MVDSPEKVLFVLGFGCISISYFKSLLDITSILKVHKQLSAILLLNYFKILKMKNVLWKENIYGHS